MCKTAKVKKKKKDTLSSKKVKDTMQILKHIMVAVTVLRITLTLTAGIDVRPSELSRASSQEEGYQAGASSPEINGLVL